MKNIITFSKYQTILFISVALYFLFTAVYPYNTLLESVPVIRNIIMCLWAGIDLVLVYKVAAAFSSTKAI